MDPINYRLNIPDPTQAVLSAAQGMGQLGLAQQQNQWAQQQHQWTEEDRARALQEAELQKQAQLAQQKALYELSQNPTPENITRTMVRYPALAEHLQKAHGNVTEQRKEQIFSTMQPIAAAFNSGNAKVARDLLTQQQAAAKNAGNDQSANAIGALLSMDDKSLAATVNGQLWATDAKRYETSMMAPEQAAKLRGEEARAQELQPYAVQEAGGKAKEAVARGELAPRKIKSEIRAAEAGAAEAFARAADIPKRYQLEVDKLKTETALKIEELTQKHGELPENALKVANDATQTAVTASATGDRMLQLAAKLEDQAKSENIFTKTGSGARWFSNWADKTFGEQGSLSKLRDDYKRLVNAEAIKGLPKGSASDKDVEIAMEGFPSGNASPERLAGFLRGMAKLSKLESVSKEAEAEWVGQRKGLVKADRDMEIMGIRVPKGTTYPEFVRANVVRLADKAFKESEKTATQSTLEDRFSKYAQ